MRLIGFDTETALIVPGLLAPPITCLSFADEAKNQMGVVDRHDGYRMMRDWLCDPEVKLIAHNAAFDVAVLCAEFPDLLPLFFDAYDAGRVEDTMLREQLLDIANGSFRWELDPLTDEPIRRKSYALGALVPGLNKTEWRTGYGMLRDVPVDTWAQGAIDYAAMDAVAALSLYKRQEQSKNAPLADSAHQARGHLALHLMSAWGMRTDSERVESLERTLEKSVEQLSAQLTDSGLVRPDGRRNMQVIRDTLTNSGITLSYTPTGQIQTGSDALKAAAEVTPELALLVTYAEELKLLTTYVPALKQGVEHPINARYNPLVETGRTSCVIGSTEILTDRGTFAISDMAAIVKEQNLRVWTHKGRWRSVSQVIRRGRAKMYRVTTESGLEIVCSKKHRFLTPTGWKRLRQMKVGDQLATENKAHERAGFRTVFLDRKADVARAEGQVRGEQGSLLCVLEALATKVRRRLEGDQFGAILGGSQDSQEELSRSEDHSGSGRFEGSARRAPAYRDDGSKVRSERIHPATQHQASRIAERGARPVGSDGVEAQYQRTASGSGAFHAGNLRGGFQAADSTFRVFLQTVRSALEVVGDGVLCEPAWQGSRSLLFASNTQGRVLEHEQIRGSVGYCATREGHTASAAGCCGTEQARSAASGFSGEGDSLRRGGWRFPCGAEADGERPQERSVHARVGHTSAAATFGLVGEGSRQGRRDSREHIVFDRIASVEAYGVETVWDLTVDEDESYLAQGFYNHNCSKPNLQNLPRGKKDKDGVWHGHAHLVREAFVPRKGNYFVFCDYDSLEVRSLGQVLYETVGGTTLKEAYSANPNFDPHTRFAAGLMGITEADALARKKAKDPELANYRQNAKAAVFGYPGGMGPKKMRDYAFKSYGIVMTEGEARALRENYFRWLPEIKVYHDRIARAVEAGPIQITQLRSDRKRGGVGFSDCANGYFQGLAADGAKKALWEVARGCYVTKTSPLYGCRPVAFIHDEIGIEAPIGQHHEAAVELERVMNEAMAWAMPDVPATSSPAVCERWYKGADAVMENGRYVPWRPKK